MSVQVRPALAADLDAIALLHRASILELCREHYNAAQLAEWTSVLRPEAYAALLASHVMLVAVDGAELLGFGVLDPQQGLVNATYVQPGSARRGVGRSLLRALEARAAADGCERVRLNATLNAVGFYAQLGYVSTGRADNRLPSGVDLPCEAMHKQL